MAPRPASDYGHAAQYRELVEAMRTLVPTWNDPETHAELAWMAACYERLAEIMEGTGTRMHSLLAAKADVVQLIWRKCCAPLDPNDFSAHIG